MIIKRREFLKTALQGTAAITTLPVWINACTSYGRTDLSKIGLMTFTVSNEMKQDYRKTLEQVSDIGYTYLEIGNDYGESPEEFMSFLNMIDLIPLAGGSHMSYLIEEENLRPMIDKSLRLGKKYLVCYWPWIDSGENLNPDKIRMAADNLNKVGKICQREGIRFAVHNHDKEFLNIQGMIPYDYFLEHTDPGQVCFEIDLYWINKTKSDPVEYFRKYPGRFELVHVKDMDNTPEQSFACVGNGIIDFKEIFAYADMAGFKHLIVEHDKPENPMECVRSSYEYLQNIL